MSRDIFTIKNKKLRQKLIQMGLLFDESDYWFFDIESKRNFDWFIASYGNCVKIMTIFCYNEKNKRFIMDSLSKPLDVYKHEDKIICLVKEMIEKYKNLRNILALEKIEEDF